MKKFTYLFAIILLLSSSNILCQYADISASPTSGSAPLKVSFRATFTGATCFSSYWNFGDGYTSTSTSPTHTYTKPGKYTVQAEFEIMTNDYPIPITCRITRIGYINVTQTNPTPNLVVSDKTMYFSGPIQTDTFLYNNLKNSNYGYYYWKPGTKMAMAMHPKGSCKIQAIQVYCSDKTQNFKIGINNLNENPDSELYESQVLTSTQKGWYEHNVENKNISINGNFLASFNMIDTIASLGYNKNYCDRAWDFDGSTWSKYNETYFINAIVKYHKPVSPEGNIVLNNLGGNNLVISEVIPNNDWIINISPDTLVVPYNVQKSIKFSFDYSKMSYGINSGTITIFSNDPNKSQFDVYITSERLITDVAEKRTFSNPVLNIFPNPVKDKMIIQYHLNQIQNVELSITNDLGIECAKFTNSAKIFSNDNTIEFDTNHLASGVYFCTLRCEDYVETIKFFVIR
ncbi:MAG: T9SS type A sorting domain-containing protein [bacterium]